MEKWENKMDEVAIVCEECGCVVATEDAVEVGGCWYCKDCVMECYECGEWSLKEDMVYCDENGEYYCEDCAERELVWCDHCETYALDAYAHTVRVSERGRREVWCSECVDNDAYECEDCGCYFSDDLGIVTRNEHHICPSCAEDYYYCGECDEYVHSDEWDDDEDMCLECAGRSNLVSNYHASTHYDKKNEFVGACRPQWRGVWRGVGVELEVDRGDGGSATAERETVRLIQDLSEKVMFERDGSISSTYGFEIITQPHTEKEFYKMPWLDILGACISGGYRSHDGGRCGLHIHLSREWFGADSARQEAPIAKLIRFYDLFYTDIVKVSRRDEEGARQWARPADTESNADARKVAKGEIYRDRYQAVNTRNARTVEIRIMRGTLNYNSFMACIDFVLTTAKNARRVRWDRVGDAREWLKGLKPETVAYIKARNAFVGLI